MRTTTFVCKPGQSIQVGDTVIRLLERRGRFVRLGIEAPKEVTILRGELARNGANPKERARDGTCNL